MKTLKGQLIRLAYKNPDLREHLLPLVKEAAAIKRPKSDHMMGINTTSWWNRKDQWWADLVKMIDSHWGGALPIKWASQAKGHLYFASTGPEGTSVSILLTGTPDKLDAIMDVERTNQIGLRPVGGKVTKRKTYDGVWAIHNIIWDLDGMALQAARKEV